MRSAPPIRRPDTPVTGLVFRGLTFSHADHFVWPADKVGTSGLILSGDRAQRA